MTTITASDIESLVCTHFKNDDRVKGVILADPQFTVCLWPHGGQHRSFSFALTPTMRQALEDGSGTGVEQFVSEMLAFYARRRGEGRADPSMTK